MTITINHPYTETPYDILSVPDDPQIGMLPFDMNHKNIRNNRFPLLTKWWKDHPNTPPKRNRTDLAKAVSQLGFPGRVTIDAFLCTTLARANDFDDLIKQQAQLPLELHAPKLDEWETDLEPWYEIPSINFSLDKVSLSQQNNYDDSQLDLYQVQFDLCDF